jgi:hypothetical protein
MLLGETPGHKFLSADHYGDAMVRAEGCEQTTLARFVTAIGG